MIKDKEMIELGFRKAKSYANKKETGVSSYVWMHESNSIWLGIEKDLGSDFGDEYFVPTFRFCNRIIFYKNIDEVKVLLNTIF